MARRHDDDDPNNPFDRNGILKDGHSTRISATVRDSASDSRPMIDAALHRPGHRFAATDGTVRVVIADDRARAYDSYERDMGQRWRGASDNEGQAEGSQCTVRSGAGRYGVEGFPGIMRMIDGELHCVADDRSNDIRSDSRRDDSQQTHRQKMEKLYALRDAEQSEAWRSR
jgi:hypothetical protein